jgi:hypothetical protein
MKPDSSQHTRRLLTAFARQKACNVLDWTSTGVILSQLRSVHGEWQPAESDWEPWPNQFDPFADPLQTANLLQSWIKARPWAAAPDVISLPRQFVSLKLLSFPIVEPAELAQLIALQLEARQSSPDATQVWDFLPHTPAPKDTQLHVSLLSAPATVCNAIRATAAAAGWKSPVLTAADLFVQHIPRPANPNTCQLTLQLNRSKLEIVASRNSIPAASLASAAPSQLNPGLTTPLLLQALIERITESLPEAWQSELHSQPIHVCGSQSSLLAEQLQSAGFQMLTGPADDRTPRAIAMARLTQPRSRHFNLLKPHSTSTSLYTRKPALVRSAVLAVLLLVAAITWLSSERSHRQKQLNLLLAKTERLQARLADYQIVPEQRAKLDTWLAASPNPAHSLAQLLALVPNQQTVLLTRIQLENLADSNEPVLSLEGLAQSPADVSQLNANILQYPHLYTLRPHGIDPAPAESQLKLHFRTECVLRQQTADEQATDIKASDEQTPDEQNISSADETPEPLP